MKHQSFVISQRLFLRSLAWIYLFAFASIWQQYPGLLGHNGLLPVDKYLKIPPQSQQDTWMHALQRYMAQPTIAHFAPMLNLHVDVVMQASLLLGMIVAGLAAVSVTPFALLYILLFVMYLSIYVVGQTFLSFQWDILLMEVGFMAILWSPFLPSIWNFGPTPWQLGNSRYAAVAHWGIRVIFFKLMFMAGVVKVQADCPAWSSLEALGSHFATQCIPTPASWYAHQLPRELLRWGVAGTLVIEIPLTFGILLPEPITRRVCAFCQLALQVSIMITGNYNFFNLLTCALAITLLDDGFWVMFLPSKWTATDEELVNKGVVTQLEKSRKGKLVYFAMLVLTIVVLGYDIQNMFQLDSSFKLKLLWGTKEVRDYIVERVPIAVGGIFIGFLFYAVQDILTGLGVLGSHRSLYHSMCAILRSCVVGFILVASVVPLLALERQLLHQYPINLVIDDVLRVYRGASQWNLVAGYGLFRKMTGLGPNLEVQRPEIDLQVLFTENNTWVSVPFIYKPDDIHEPPKYVAPHQPRLDWQMWFAALGTYQQAPWLVHLCDRLLQNEPDVLELLDISPYMKHVLEHSVKVRAIRYKYDFTRLGDTSWNNTDTITLPKHAFLDGPNDTRWWWKANEEGEEYLPAIERGNPSVQKFLEMHGLGGTSSTQRFDAIQDCNEKDNSDMISSFVCNIVTISRSHSDTFAFSFVVTYIVLAVVRCMYL